MRYVLLLTCPQGIEDVVEREIKEKVGRVRKIQPKFLGLRGRILVEVSKSKIPKFFLLKSIHHIFKYITDFKISCERIGLKEIYDHIYSLDLEEVEKCKTFRVTSERLGVHEFTSMDIQKVAGQAIVDKYGKKVDLKNFDVNIEVDVVGERCYVGIKLTKESLHRRGYRKFNHPAAIKPTLAYGMIRLAGIEKGHVVVDPMCGGGTIPIECVLEYDGKISVFASDISKKFLEGAKKNARAAEVSKFIKFSRLDCRKMESFYDEESLDRIITNPPYGVRLETRVGRLKDLYEKFLVSASRVLREDGKLILICLKANMFRYLLFKTGKFGIEEERVVGHGGLFPHLFILRRI